MWQHSKARVCLTVLSACNLQGQRNGFLALLQFFNWTKFYSLLFVTLYASLKRDGLFWKKFGERQSFLWGHWYPWFGLLVMFAPSFKTRVDPLTCRLHLMRGTESTDSPLVRYLLTSWRPEWQPSRSHPHTWAYGLDLISHSYNKKSRESDSFEQ